MEDVILLRKTVQHRQNGLHVWCGILVGHQIHLIYTMLETVGQVVEKCGRHGLGMIQLLAASETECPIHHGLEVQWEWVTQAEQVVEGATEVGQQMEKTFRVAPHDV